MLNLMQSIRADYAPLVLSFETGRIFLLEHHSRGVSEHHHR